MNLSSFKWNIPCFPACWALIFMQSLSDNKQMILKYTQWGITPQLLSFCHIFLWGKFRDGTKFEASRSAPANEHSNGNSETSSVQWTLQWRSSTLAGWRSSTLAFFPHSTSPATGGPSGKRLGTTWCHAGLMWKSKILPKKVAQGKHENTAALYTVVFEQFHTHLLSWRVAVVGEWPAQVLCLMSSQAAMLHQS